MTGVHFPSQILATNPITWRRGADDARSQVRTSGVGRTRWVGLDLHSVWVL